MRNRKPRATNYNDAEIVKQYGIYPLIHQVVTKPELLKFIGPVKGKRILDFGCGNGHITFELDRRGAQCIGVDPSSKFIGEAQRKYPKLDFRVIGTSRIDGIKSNYFDVVISNLVLPSLNSRQEFKRLFEESNRVLKTGGQLFISALHPLMVRNFKDGFRAVRFPANLNYFSTGGKFENDVLLTNGAHMTFMNMHWTLEDISDELEVNNFVITAIKEPKMSSKKFFDLLKDSFETPYVICFRAKKLASKA